MPGKFLFSFILIKIIIEEPRAARLTARAREKYFLVMVVAL
jgi:hypothetical protein